MPIFGLALATLPNAAGALKRGEVDNAGAVDHVLRGDGFVVAGAVYEAEDLWMWKEERGEIPGLGVEVKVDMGAGNRRRGGRCIPSKAIERPNLS